MFSGSRRHRIFSPVLAATIAAGLAPALSACSGDVNPMREAAFGLGQGVKVAEPADFVKASRPEGGSAFMPVGVSAPKRPARAKNPEGQKALEAELEGARSRNLAQGRAAESAAKAQPKAPAPNAVPPAE